MNKWEEIAKTTNILNKGLNDIWDRKLKKDASVIVGDVWSDFVLNSSKHLTDAQNHIDVATDEKSGTLACLMQFPDNHPDYQFQGKPFSSFILSDIQEKSDTILQSLKNPYAKNILASKLAGYRENITNKLSNYEANLVMDKRANMAVENIEKLAHATYNNPELFASNREDALIAINSLDISLQKKSKLASEARNKIAESAALSVLSKMPETILNPEINYQWKDDLNVRILDRITRQASHALELNSRKKISEFEQLSKIHFQNILDNGNGISGITQKLESLPEDFAKDFIIKEELHKDAYDVLEQVKYTPLSGAWQIVASIAPSLDDTENYQIKSALYQLVSKQVAYQEKLARTNPAKYVEELFNNELANTSNLGDKISQRLELQTQKGVPSYRQKLLTSEEREEFALMLDSRDAPVIEQNLNNILSIESNYQNLGHHIVEEILADNNSSKKNTHLSALTHFYIDANIHKRVQVKHDIARAMVSGQALGEMSSYDEKKIKDNINKGIKDWQAQILAGNTDNAPEVLTMNAGLLELARFYQFEKHISANEASDLALNNLFNASYIAPYKSWQHGKFYLPRSVIEDGKLHELDESNINHNLITLRGNLINNKIEYDYISSFGKEYYRDQTLDSREVQKALRDGTFRVTKDKKSIYYVYFDNQGEHALMQSEHDVAIWPLLELNNIIAPRDNESNLDALNLFNYEVAI